MKLSLLVLLSVVAVAFCTVHVAEDFANWSKEDLSLFLETHVPLLRNVPGRATFIPRASSIHSYEELVKGSNQPYLWFEQKLDHFTYNNQTWKQRYQVDTTYWKPGNPIFIFLDGEASMNFFPFQEVSAYQWAQHFGAMYISLEHRYYGESLPFLDFSTKNMQYLSSQQALADAANFIDQYNSTISKPGPWVVFGCSYSGALSAWFRAKYPNSVIASVAPSGPVLAQMNFTMYYGQFGKSLEIEGFYDCKHAVEQGVAQVDQILNTTDGLAQLAKTFNACKPIDPNQLWYFKGQLMGAVGGSDQMDNPPDWPLNQTCKIMTQSTDYLANWAQVLGTSHCNDFDQQTSINLLRLTVPNSNRAWFWQVCTEFGFFQPSYPGTSIFWGDIPLEPFVAWCQAVFDIPNMAPNVNWTNTFYGGYDLKASNVMFTNGLLDPWHNLSIYKNPPPGVQAVVYDAGHCATMDAPDPTDPVSLVNARARVQTFLSVVISEWYGQHGSVVNTPKH
mmetsp:Transcript_53932/g.89749  ORF Transcript_53932/g.89749 Transcript_53932/m.89749 type:complete len:504 (-) Transcript_53932:91-1602(-)